MSETSGEGLRPLYRFWQPRYWPIWLGLALLRVIAALPYRLQWHVGRALGNLLYVTLSARRRVASVNIRLCFPELAEAGQAQLVRDHFRSLGLTIVEHGMTWWTPSARIAQRVHLKGAEHLQAALATGRGVVLLTGHFGAQEVTGPSMRTVCSYFGGLYRPSRNEFIDELFRRIRLRSVDVLVPKQNLRQLIRLLRQGTPIWYASDQSQRRAFGALVPFCGEPAMTNTALTEIVRLGKALVVPLFPTRLPDGRGYELEILPALTDFPGESPEADALRINQLIETHVRKVPEQYYWIHRRFKGRPAPLSDPY